jgi:hypothetical protein
LHPGDPKKLASFELFDKRGAHCAAYLGYSDIRDLRRFVTSDEFLRIYHRFNQGWSANMNVKKALTLILTDYVGEADRVGFPPQLDELGRYEMPGEKKDSYSEEENVQRVRYLAHILIVMVDLWGNSGGEPVEEIDDEGDHDSAYFRHELERIYAHIEHVPYPSTNAPVIRPRLIRDDFEEKESDLEPYNRAWNLLKYFKYVTGSKDHWKSGFGDSETWDRSTIITTPSIPDWMRGASPAPTLPPLANAHANLPPRRIKLRWDRNGQAADDKALEAYLEANEDELDLPNPVMNADGDPRVHNEFEFRDRIRLQYECETNRMQIAKLTMRIWPEGSGDGGKPGIWNLLTCDWSYLVDDLRTSSEQVEVKVKLRLLKEGEEVVMES